MLAAARKIADDTGMLVAAAQDDDGDEIPAWNGFNVLHTAAARVAGLDLGFLPSEGGRDVAGIIDGAASGDVKLVYLLGADEVDSDFGDAFVVYQGHHGDRGAHGADVILPGAAYTEKDGLYVNTEGRVQMGVAAAFPPGEAREDWKIIRALSEAVGKTLPFSTLEDVRTAMRKDHPSFAAIDTIEPAEWGDFGAAGAMDDAPFAYPVDNFYMTDPISRASKTMAECTEAFVLPKREAAATGTDG